MDPFLPCLSKQLERNEPFLWKCLPDLGLAVSLQAFQPSKLYIIIQGMLDVCFTRKKIEFLSIWFAVLCFLIIWNVCSAAFLSPKHSLYEFISHKILICNQSYSCLRYKSAQVQFSRPPRNIFKWINRILAPIHREMYFEQDNKCSGNRSGHVGELSELSRNITETFLACSKCIFNLSLVIKTHKDTALVFWSKV